MIRAWSKYFLVFLLGWSAAVFCYADLIYNK